MIYGVMAALLVVALPLGLIVGICLVAKVAAYRERSRFSREECPECGEVFGLDAICRSVKERAKGNAQGWDQAEAESKSGGISLGAFDQSLFVECTKCGHWHRIKPDYL